MVATPIHGSIVVM